MCFGEEPMFSFFEMDYDLVGDDDLFSSVIAMFDSKTIAEFSVVRLDSGL